mmetsp:Transcript_7031/g.21410  ORF Transcript_7031/g.21410 Transcript_7031/m.21410 type:complete len:230 (-) Transcript_7031:261-950(-)
MRCKINLFPMFFCLLQLVFQPLELLLWILSSNRSGTWNFFETSGAWIPFCELAQIIQRIIHNDTQTFEGPNRIVSSFRKCHYCVWRILKPSNAFVCIKYSAELRVRTYLQVVGRKQINIAHDSNYWDMREVLFDSLGYFSERSLLQLFAGQVVSNCVSSEENEWRLWIYCPHFVQHCINKLHRWITSDTAIRKHIRLCLQLCLWTATFTLSTDPLLICGFMRVVNGLKM